MKEVLAALGAVNLAVWLAAPAAAFLAGRRILTPKTAGWKIVSAGSGFVVLRQLIKLLPGYDAAANPPEVWLPFHFARYLCGTAAALILLAGFAVLLIDYLKLEARLGEEP